MRQSLLASHVGTRSGGLSALTHEPTGTPGAPTTFDGSAGPRVSFAHANTWLNGWPAGLIPLTRNEIARLVAALIIQPAADTRYRLSWSAWRRRHQRTAQACHYRRQAAQDP